MEKKELREKTFEVYRKVFETDKEPSLFELAKLLDIIAPAIQMCDDSEQELGKELVDSIKRCTKVFKHTVSVDITKFANEIGLYEK